MIPSRVQQYDRSIKMSKEETPWVVAGCKSGEMAHCKRCGAGLSLALPQSLSVIVATTKAFNKDHSRCKPSGYAEPIPLTPREWAAGRDIGISSMTICFVMTGIPTALSGYDTPKDPSDFGRCYRFLALFPQFRPRLTEVAHRFPKWLPLVTNWEELERLYVAAVEGGSGEILYHRMRELNGESPSSVSTKETND
jgi:hypothetical protein